MNFDEVKTFLSVVETTNIAKAANQLFISQGTASTRIQNLEIELGIKLFYRQKGIKGVVLTPEGEIFLPIAHKYISICQEAEHIKELEIYKELRVGASDMFNSFILPEAYKSFIESYSEIVLTIQTEHSTEIHQLIENQQLDIGLVWVLHNFPSVFSKPLYEEEMVYIYHKDSTFSHTGNEEYLLPENEVYLHWSHEFARWHRQHFPKTNRKKITLGTVSMLPNFLGNIDDWSIVSKSIATILVKRIPVLKTAYITSPPPKRTAYLLYHKYPKPWVSESSNLFLNEVIKSINKNPDLILLYKNN